MRQTEVSTLASHLQADPFISSAQAVPHRWPHAVSIHGAHKAEL